MTTRPEKLRTRLMYDIQCEVTSGIPNLDRDGCKQFNHTGRDCWILYPDKYEELPEKWLHEKCEKCEIKDAPAASAL